MIDTQAIRQRWDADGSKRDERGRRLFAASEVRAAGWGGLAAVSDVTGLARSTIGRGLKDLDTPPLAPGQVRRDGGGPRQLTDRDPTLLQDLKRIVEPATLGDPVRPLRITELARSTSYHGPSDVRHSVSGAGARQPHWIRRPGGGRKLNEEKDPTIVTALEQMLKDEVAGDPTTEQKWIRSSLRRLSGRLADEGHQASTGVVARLLKKMGFSQKANERKQGRSGCPDRDEQFKYIASQKQQFVTAGLPIISVDTKKKELIGDFRNKGRTWRRQAENVNEHDFLGAAKCRAIPFGIYDPTRNEGYVYVGVSNDTPQFAVYSIARWWEGEGRRRYKGASALLILADSGGSNGCRARAWKLSLQEKLCDESGLTVTVCHYPTGCSKWNPIEHRLFSFISMNWEGKPLRTLEVMLGYIRGTSTMTGLSVKAFLDERFYARGRKVTGEDIEGFRLKPHTVCPKWNYTLHPRKVRE
jgi:hypothetical protein